MAGREWRGVAGWSGGAWRVKWCGGGVRWVGESRELEPPKLLALDCTRVPEYDLGADTLRDSECKRKNMVYGMVVVVGLK